MASNLIEYSADVLQANKQDLEDAMKDGIYCENISKQTKIYFFFLLNHLLSYRIYIYSGLKASLVDRLGLSEKKLQTLSIGLQQIAEKTDVLGSFKFA